MRNIIILIAIGIAAAAGYQYYQAENGAYSAYKTFATDLFRGKWDEARKMTTGSKAASQFNQVSGIYKRYYGKFREGPLGPKYTLVSKTKLDSGNQFNLTLTQTVRADLFGGTSVMGTSEVTFQHLASLIKEGNDWKIQSLTCSYVPPKKTS